MNDANDMKKTLSISNGRLVDTDGNPLSRLRPVFAFGCDYEVTLSLSEPLPSDVTRLVAMLDTDFDFAEKSEVCALAEFSPGSMTFSMATRTRRFAEVISGRSSSVGYLQIDAIHEDGTNTRVLLDRVILQGVVADSSESFAVASVRGLEISERGTWVIDGVDTGQPARGVPGVSPSAKVSVDEKGNVILTVTDASGTTEQVISADKAAQDSLIKRIEQAESEVASLKESKTDRTEHDELESRVELVESGVSSLESSKADRESTLAGYGITDAYTQSETDELLNAKADKASVYTKTETDAKLDAKANVATTLSGYGIHDAYTKTETDGLLDAKAGKATTIAGYGITDAYTKTEVDAMAPMVGTTAPTADTVGFVGQLYVDTATGKTYHCTARTNTGTDEEPSWRCTWEDDINAKGGKFVEQIDINYNYYRTLIRNSNIGVGYNITNGSYGTITAGNSCYGLGRYYSIVVGSFLAQRDGGHPNAIFGQYNQPVEGTLILGNGTSGKERSNSLVAYANGDLYIAGSHQQGISVIPNTTTACALSECVYSHIPDSAPTYTLPAVADTGRTHEIVLNVRFGGTALSYSFEDTSGNAIAPLSTPAVEDGTVISFLCRHEPLLEQWAIMPVSLGRREVTA